MTQYRWIYMCRIYIYNIYIHAWNSLLHVKIQTVYKYNVYHLPICKRYTFNRFVSDKTGPVLNRRKLTRFQDHELHFSKIYLPKMY